MKNKNKLLFAAIAGLIAVSTLLFYTNGSENLKGLLNMNTKSYSLSSRSVTFVNTMNGAYSTRSITVKNESLRKIKFSWSELPDSDVFAIENPNNFSIAAGATKVIRFKFAPTENINQRYADSVVLSGDGKTKRISLEGDGGEAFHVSSTEVTFPPTVVGHTSFQEVEIENFSGNLIEFDVNDPISRMYQIEGDTTFSVAPRSSTVLRFSFTPRIASDFEPELEAGMIYAVNLEDAVDMIFSGTGIAAR